MKLKIWIFLSGSVIFFTTPALAQTEIRFRAEDLAAGVVLMKPDLNSIELNGQSGDFSPSPALRAIGVEEQKFDLNFTGLSALADIQFDRLRAQTPAFEFNEKHVVFTLPIQDQKGAVHTSLGSISFQGVVLTATLGWKGTQDGSTELAVLSTQFAGVLTGTGILKPKWVIKLAQKLLVRSFTQELSNFFAQASVQTTLPKALLVWAKFYTGHEWTSVVPGSAQFFLEGNQTGLKYQVE